jgi:hypothetical protein
MTKIKKFKDKLQLAKPIVIKAIPVHGKHAQKKIKKKKLNEATEIENANSYLGRFKTPDQLREEHEDLVNHYKDLHQHHGLDHVHAYTTSSGALNKHLIRGKTDDPDLDRYYKSKIAGIDDAINDAPKLHRDLHVFHGLAGWHPGMEAYKHPERKIELPAYTSASLDPTMATSFGNRDRGGHRHMLQIHLKKGSKHGIYVDHVSDNYGEKEFLIKHGTKFKIDRKPTILKDRDKRSPAPWSTPTDTKAKHTYIWHAHPIDE